MSMEFGEEFALFLKGRMKNSIDFLRNSKRFGKELN